MHMLENLFKLLGMVAAFAAAVFTMWYHWIAPKDWRRSRNSATLLSLLFVIVLCVFLFFENIENAKRIKVFEKKLENDQSEIQQIKGRYIHLRDSLEIKNKNYNELEKKIEAFKEKSIRDEIRLFNYLQNLKIEFREIERTSGTIKAKIVELRYICKNKLLDSTRRGDMYELLMLLDRKGLFSFFDPDVYITQLNRQIEQTDQFTRFLITQLNTLETESGDLEERLKKMQKNLDIWDTPEKIGKREPLK